ncbi:MAG: cupin domain-containing protein [Solirubrobacteraceae bacterium]|nr:cupin domain-containing protein [Solirubrobacteraceae bacterium]
MSEPDVTTGEGYSISSLDRLGDGFGFRKIRTPMGLTAFGANAVTLPPDYPTRNHFHEEQEELYFVHRGTIEFTFGDGTTHRVEEGGLVWVAPHTVRQLRSVGEGAIYLCVGGKDGYVPRDGRPGPTPAGE